MPAYVSHTLTAFRTYQDIQRDRLRPLSPAGAAELAADTTRRHLAADYQRQRNRALTTARKARAAMALGGKPCERRLMDLAQAQADMAEARDHRGKILAAILADTGRCEPCDGIGWPGGDMCQACGGSGRKAAAAMVCETA